MTKNVADVDVVFWLLPPAAAVVVVAVAVAGIV